MVNNEQDRSDNNVLQVFDKVQDPKSVNKDQDSNATRSSQNAQGSVSERKHFEISQGSDSEFFP